LNVIGALLVVGIATLLQIILGNKKAAP
jgi:hypothetical protein